MDTKRAYTPNPYTLDVDGHDGAVKALLAELKAAREVIAALENAIVILVRELKDAKK